MSAAPTQPLQPVGGPAAWTAATLDPGWCRAFTGPELDRLDAALTVFRSASPSLDLLRLDDDTFPLTGFGTWIEEVRTALVAGSGVAAYEGFPVERYGEEELRALWWGVSRAVGTPVSQSWRGDLIGDVRDLGTGISGPRGRGYTSNTELNFHADAADVSGLFFLRTAPEGGVNRVASAVTTHDVLTARYPDRLELLYEPLPWSWQDNQPPGEPAWYEMPVFGRAGPDPRSGPDLACAYVRTNILLSHENAGAPPLSPEQHRAVQTVVEVAAEPGMWVERRFDPGAMLFVYNHTVLHLRTAFVDHPEPERRRHLLRTWMSPPNSRALPASFAPFFGSVEAGAVRGGYPGRGSSPRFTTV